MASSIGKKSIKRPVLVKKDEMDDIPDANIITDKKPDFLDESEQKQKLEKTEEKQKKNDSEDIKIDSKVKSTSDTVNISTKEEDDLLDVVKQDSQRSQPHDEKISKDIEGFKDLTREELDKKVKAIDDGGEKLSAGELFDVAMAIEEILDLVLSFVFAIIAKDKSGSSSEYGITKEKKMIIAKNLSMVFAKYQASIGVVTLLILSIFAAYAPAAKKSMDNRKKSTRSKTNNESESDSTAKDSKKPVGRPPKS